MKIIEKLLNTFKLKDNTDITDSSENPPFDSFESIFEYKSVTFRIAGTEYDIMKKEDVEKIPCLPAKANILGKDYGIDYILRKNAVHIYNSNGDYDLASACIRKSNELVNAGHGTQGVDEIERAKQAEKRHQQRESDKKKMIEISNSITVEDMLAFPNLPFELQWVLKLQHINGIAWFPLNMNNQFIALSVLNYINGVLEQANDYLPPENEFYICLENISFDYLSPVTIDSLPATYVECCPYTLTHKNSKYPMALHFTEVEGELTFFNRSSFGTVYFMRDGNIGKADIIIGDAYIQFRLIGINLIVKRVDKLINSRYQTIYIYEH